MSIVVFSGAEISSESLSKFPSEIIYVPLGYGQVNAAVNATEAINKYHPELVVHLGTCGALKPNQKQGQILVGTKFINGDYDMFDFFEGFEFETIENDNEIIEKLKDIFLPGTFHTVSQFCAKGTKRKLRGGDVVDMETFAVAKACKDADVKFMKANMGRLCFQNRSVCRVYIYFMYR